MSVLLDTCAVIWLGHNDPMSATALKHIEAARSEGGVLISAVSAWELGLAATRDKRPLTFLPDVAGWLARVLAMPGVRGVSLDPDAALSANLLPAWAHRDPADRFLVASARALDVPIVTSDAKILAYATAGHVRAIAC